jgi:hypothetical protein
MPSNDLNKKRSRRRLPKTKTGCGSCKYDPVLPFHSLEFDLAAILADADFHKGYAGSSVARRSPNVNDALLLAASATDINNLIHNLPSLEQFCAGRHLFDLTEECSGPISTPNHRFSRTPSPLYSRVRRSIIISKISVQRLPMRSCRISIPVQSDSCYCRLRKKNPLFAMASLPWVLLM